VRNPGGGAPPAGGGVALLERPAIPQLELPPDLPPGIDGALWSSWAARWQEF
jgi:hypothetical protein